MIAAARWLSLLLLLPATAVRAESAVMLSPRSERALSAAERAELTAALEHALRAQGVHGVAMDATEACADHECIAAALRARDAAHAAELTVWHAADGTITGVSISLVQAAGERYSEGAQVKPGHDVTLAIEEAARGAYARMRRGPGPWLALEGVPAGASITVDGQAAGVLPRQVKVAGGLHRVVVSHPGYTPLDETVTVPRNPDALKHVSIALTASPPPATRAVDMRARPSVVNYAIAGVAAAAAAVLAIRPLRTAIEDGECGRIEDERCTGVVEFDAVQALQLSAAGLLLATGVTIAVWAPLRDTPEDPMTRVVVSGHF
jgi:hypothetical protein